MNNCRVHYKSIHASERKGHAKQYGIILLDKKYQQRSIANNILHLKDEGYVTKTLKRRQCNYECVGYVAIVQIRNKTSQRNNAVMMEMSAPSCLKFPILPGTVKKDRSRAFIPKTETLSVYQRDSFLFVYRHHFTQSV